MWPTGDFARFKADIMNHYDEYREITFGILIADIRQQEAREYILNYLDRFNALSGKIFDFFIPGYAEISGSSRTDNGILVDPHGGRYRFREDMFYDFIEALSEHFSVEYTYNPMLILMSMRPGHVDTAKIIIIELDALDIGLKRSGMFFSDLFKATKSSASLEDIQGSLVKTYIKGNALDSIVNAIGLDWLKEFKNQNEKIRRFAIKAPLE